MRNLNYKVKSFRISEKVYEELKKRRGKLSWNLLFELLLEVGNQTATKIKIRKETK